MPSLLLLPPNSANDYASFTDESSISGYRYMVVGGVTCRSAYADVAHQAIGNLQAKARYPTDSFQWKHFRPDKFGEYKAVIDLFLSDNADHRVDFSCIVIDKHLLNHRRYNEGDAETFFQKVIYQYVLAMAHRYGYPSVIRSFHGNRESRYDLEEIRHIINAGLSKKVEDVLYRPLRQLEYMNVDSSGMHQLADILIGCVSYYWNVSQQRKGLSRKRLLAEYVHSECCAASLGQRTPFSMEHFDIWQMKLRVNPRT